MKILIVTGSYPPMMCGVGDYTHQLAKALAMREGVKIEVLTSEQARGDRVEAGVTVHTAIRAWTALELFRLFAFIRGRKPQVVHVQYPTLGYTGRLPDLLPLVAYVAGARVVQTWHEPMQLRSLLLRLMVPSEFIVVRANLREMLSGVARWLLAHRTLHYIEGASSLPVSNMSAEDRAVLRERYLCGQRRLVVFFGFAFEHKGVDLLFDIANAETDHLVIAGNTRTDSAYESRLIDLAQGRWAGKVTFTGFLSPDDAARLLSISDAVLLPFRTGGGEWNSSIHGASDNGAYVITTSTTRRDYDPVRNIAYAAIDDINGMRAALDMCDARKGASSTTAASRWKDMSDRHMDVYLSHRASG